MRRTTRTRWLVLIVVVGAALRFFPIWFGLPYPQARPDEETAIGKALSALNEEPNPRFFHWPSLTFYVFAGVLRVAQGALALAGDARDLTFSEQALVTRGLIALAGTATILVLFRIARRFAGDRVALLAAAFLAVAILHVRESHFAMTDVLMTLLLWASLAALLDVPGAPAPAAAAARTCAIAGVLAGLAASTKYSAAAVAVSMLAVQGLLFVRAPRDALTWRGWLPIAAFGLTMVAAFVVGTPHAVLDFATFSRDLAYDFEHLAEGHRGILLGRGWGYHATHSLPYGAGIAVFAAALPGFVLLGRQHRPHGVVLLAFGVAFYYAIGSGYTVFFRYVLPLVPLVCLAAAVAVSRASDWIAARWRVRPSTALVALGLMTAGPSLVQSTWFDLLLARTDSRVLAGRWLTERLRPDDSLYDAGGPFTRLNIWQIPFDEVEYDPATRTFSGGRQPDWIVLYQSPLSAYTPTPAGLPQLVASDYERVFTVRATRGRARSAMYDRQDAFFLPFSGFTTVERPGPTIFIYRRSNR